jgi:type I restriction-modification system DNA methylase subunit
MILKQWKQLQEMDAYAPLYKRFKKYFGYLNTGHKGKKYDVYPYNGGLFKPDEVLDLVKIDDELLYKYTLKLSEYDFASEVDVNILGHIFENSLNEIEEIQTQLEENPTEVKLSKRKKDGVFYTPKYITKYIVENTIGKLCEEKKTEVNLVEEDYNTNRQTKTKKDLLKKLNTYREWLLQLTVVDPACGSGAFLNEALNYLIAEHQYLDELETKLMGGGLVFPNVEKGILENNLFGVDINNESVEIAKLSLWLRTAQPNRKLNDLSNNIKCGNSLIDDPEVAGDNAFNWEKEFPQIFSKGGFDVVIGNPPYVFARDNFSKEIKQHYSKSFVSAEYQINLYLLFIERAITIIKDSANFGLIVPNAWLMVDSAKGLRNLILKKCSVNQIINLTGYSFEGVNVETIIIIATKKIENDLSHFIKVFLSSGIEFKFSHNRKQLDFSKNKGYEFKVFSNERSVELTKKIKENSDILDNLVHIKAGLQAYEKNKGEPKQSAEDVKRRPYDYNYKFNEHTHKYLEGRDVGRYFINWSGQYLSYGKQLASPRTFDLFNGEKIIVREITGKFPNSIISTYDNSLYLYNRSNIGILAREETNISLKYVISIINSKLMAYYFMKNTAKSVRKMFPKIILNDLRKFPIKKLSITSQQYFIDKAEQMLVLNEKLLELSLKFERSLQRQFQEELEKLPRKLQDWHELSYTDFVKELKKKKIKLSLSQEAEWEDYFLEEQEKAVLLKTQIDTTDTEINQMVYELYGLTKEEIEIVENS